MLYDFRDLWIKGRFQVTVRKHIQQSSPYIVQAGLCDNDFAADKSTKNETEWICVMGITKKILDSRIRRKVQLLRNLKTLRFFDQRAP